MFETHWCDQCNVPVLSGICGNCGKKLNSRMPDNLRPVFHEELELLQKTTGEDLKEFSDFSLWANRRTYYWMGKPLFVVNGGNLLTNPTISWKRKNRESVDQPFSIEVFRKANSGPVRSLTEEAKQFIEETYRKYKEDVDLTTVAFSGGKDSTVILDLAGKALNKDSYKVIFIDTKFELPDTYEYVNEMAMQYEILKSEPKREPIDLWREMLPPSRRIRWCCSALKTGPYELLVRRLSTKSCYQNLAFEGTRAAESTKRSKYDRISFQSKIHSQVSARPIFEWSTFEVWSYIIFNSLQFNYSYRHGYERIGCILCPFGTERDELMTKLTNVGLIEPFLAIIEDFAVNSSITCTEQYIANGNWKLRGGGKRFGNNQNMKVEKVGNEINALVSKRDSEMSLQQLLSVIGRVILVHSEEKIIILNIENEQGSSLVRVEDKGLELNIKVSLLGSSSSSLLTSILYQLNKYAYCVYCGVCESLCPVSAIKIAKESYVIDASKCVRCGKCIKLVSYGCHASLSKTVGGVFFGNRST
ncbi:MAG: phosphoadenosine phosphosulfate reductase family protein [Thermotogaceae bacterium]|nr:phosphoadenosine phosphosulfate reductase family protein [Thermotogaceae bacterium]